MSYSLLLLVLLVSTAAPQDLITAQTSIVQGDASGLPGFSSSPSQDDSSNARKPASFNSNFQPPPTPPPQSIPLPPPSNNSPKDSQTFASG